MITPKSHAYTYIQQLKSVLDRLSLDQIDQVICAIEAAGEQGSQIFIIGNGGSAATASHMMNDFNRGTPGRKGDMPAKRLRVFALTDNVPSMTAWANDTDYTRIFSEQLRSLARRGDVLVAISASGNSPNIIAAVEAGREIGLRIVGLTGFGGGKLAKLADVNFDVPSSEYGPVEDVHMILDHIVTSYLHLKLREQQGA